MEGENHRTAKRHFYKLPITDIKVKNIGSFTITLAAIDEFGGKAVKMWNNRDVNE